MRMMDSKFVSPGLYCMPCHPWGMYDLRRRHGWESLKTASTSELERGPYLKSQGNPGGGVVPC